MYIRILIYSLALFFVPILSKAATAWQVVPNESSITFIGTKNNMPIIGNFKTFIGVINFDPTQLNTSNVRVMIDINSISTVNKEIAETLKGSDWFDAKSYPQAIFNANKFIQVANNTYSVNGDLTIRDKTLPVTLTLVLDEYSPTKFHGQGSLKIKRTQFDIGRGEWAKTDVVKDDIQVNFNLTAIRRAALKP
jgi:polyisoprenoid-binding protein YceI